MINGCCVFSKRKSSIVAIISVIILGIFAGFSSAESGDALMYKNDYYDSLYHLRLEPGYMRIRQLSFDAGLSFEIFRLLIFYFCAFLIYLGVKSFTNNYNLFILFYTISIFYFLEVI